MIVDSVGERALARVLVDEKATYQKATRHVEPQKQ